jgi:histidinol-phosphate phosphatase family protein
LLVRECNLGGTFNFFLRGGFDALLLVKYTDHPKDSDLVSLNAVGKVEGLLTYPHKVIPDIPIATSGIMHCRLDFIPDIAPSKPFDLFKDLIPTRLESKIYAVFHQGIIRDVGTIDRLKVAGKLVKHVTKYDKSKVALILDRDGTLIEDIPYNCNPVELKLFQHSYFLASGLDGLCDFVAVITNQPLIARGLGTLMQVEKFNGALVDALGSKSAIDAFFVCPHHPDLGFQGEVPELKTPCNCRKPEVFSFIRAANRGEFYLTNSIVVGDSEKDIHSAMRIGAKWLHIHNGTMFSSLNCEYNFNFNGSCATPGNMKDRIMELYDSI